jgi:hypothetical protein
MQTFASGRVPAKCLSSFLLVLLPLLTLIAVKLHHGGLSGIAQVRRAIITKILALWLQRVYDTQKVILHFLLLEIQASDAWIASNPGMDLQWPCITNP